MWCSDNSSRVSKSFSINHGVWRSYLKGLFCFVWFLCLSATCIGHASQLHCSHLNKKGHRHLLLFSLMQRCPVALAIADWTKDWYLSGKQPTHCPGMGTPITGWSLWSPTTPLTVGSSILPPYIPTSWDPRISLSVLAGICLYPSHCFSFL